MKQSMKKLLRECLLFGSLQLPFFCIAASLEDPLQSIAKEALRGCGSCTCLTVNQKLRVLDTKEDAIQSEVLIINSVVDTIAGVISNLNASQFQSIESLLEIVSQITIGSLVSTVDVISSFVDILNVDVGVVSSQVDFLDSKTDACCQQTQSRLDTINSKVDEVSTDADAVLSLVNAIDSLVDNIDAQALTSSSILAVIESKTDACCNQTQSNLIVIDSKVDNADTDILSTLSIVTIVDSKVDNADADILRTLSETEVIDSKADACCQQTQSKLNAIDSKVDNADNDILSTFSLVDVVQSKIDNANNDILITLSETEVIESKTDACCQSTQSMLNVIESKVDNTDNDIRSTLSLVTVVDSKVDNADSDILRTLSETEVIDSKTDACCDLTQSKLNVIDSKVDNADNNILTAFSVMEVIESKVDNADIDILTTLSVVETIESKTDSCCDVVQSMLNVIDSKVDNADIDILNALSTIIVIDSKVDNADKDILSTLSVTELIDSKTDACCNLTQSKLNVIDSKVDNVDVDVLINMSIAEIIESKTDSCCDAVESKLDFANSLIEDIDSKIDFLGACASTPFFGGTISASGSYCLATDLTGATPLITIAASDVVLNLSGHTLSATSGVQGAIQFDSSSNWSNVIIQNGFITGNNANGIVVPSHGAPFFQNIQFINLSITNLSTGINIADTQDLTIQNVITQGNNSTGLTISTSTGTATNIRIMNSSFNSNGTGANLVSCADLFIKDSTFNENNNQGLISAATNVQIESCSFNNTENISPGMEISGGSNIKIKDSTFNRESGLGNQEYGLQIGSASAITVEHCLFNGNVSDGVHMEVSGSTPSCVEFAKCEAHNNGSNGFNLMGTGITVRNCFACANGNDGYAAPSSITKLCIIDSIAKSNNTGFSFTTGGGLIKENVATGNTTCGFNDVVGALTGYSYVANAGKDNGGTPAGSPNDTNYCINSLGNSFNGTGPGAAPYYEFSQTATGKSYWDNITLP